MKSFILGTIALALLLPSAAQEPLPVEKESHHRVVKENSYVRVLDIILAPGEATAEHRHSRDALQVMISPSKMRVEVTGQPPADIPEWRPGDIAFASFAKTPLTHRIKNTGTFPLHMIEVEFLAASPAPPQTPFQQEGEGYKQVLDNDRVRVFRRVLPAGATVAMHTHHRPTLGISVTGGSMVYETVGLPTRSAEVDPATVAWPQVPFTHSFKNVGKTTAIMIDIEPK
jgi:quercetin dioxygenase-like cupin family protein